MIPEQPLYQTFVYTHRKSTKNTPTYTDYFVAGGWFFGRSSQGFMERGTQKASTKTMFYAHNRVHNLRKLWNMKSTQLLK